MTIRTEPLPSREAGAARTQPPCPAGSTGRAVFSWLMMALPILFLAALVGYPLFYGVLLSLEDRRGRRSPDHLSGCKNFITDFHDPIFWRVTVNTFVYTGVATLLKMVGGLGLALAMNQHFRMKNLVRALLLLPFIVPTVLSTVAWMWMLDPAFSVVNRLLVGLGMPPPGPSWLGNPILAMFSIIVINTWRGLPFYGITLLAGLQTVPPELYEAATIDGAGGWQRFRYVTLAAVEADHPDRDAVLGDLHLRRFPASLRADAWRSAERDPAFCDLCLRYRHGRGPIGPRRVGRAGNVAGAWLC